MLHGRAGRAADHLLSCLIGWFEAARLRAGDSVSMGPDMPDLDFLTTAYEGGQTFGRVVRWVLLLAVGAFLVRRLVRGSFGAGFRRSPAGAVLGLVAVAAGLIFSVVSDFGDDDMSRERANIVAGCVGDGLTASFCGCYADGLLARMEHDRAKFAALEQKTMRDQAAGRPLPALVTETATRCAAGAASTSSG